MKRSGWMSLVCVVAVALLCPVVANAGAGTIYVDDDADTNGDGSSWAMAFQDLQDALADAGTNGLITEIWVAQGTYRPTCMPDPCAGTNGLRTVSFELIDGVGIYGGFVGTETNRDERDWEARPTILSGDLAGNDIPTNGPDIANNDENSYHVVTSGKDITSNATLDGFTITSGNANGVVTSQHDCGGGMHNSNGSPTVTNCTFSGNSAIYSGGGMNNHVLACSTITNCTFNGNSAITGSGMQNWGGRPTLLVRCTFRGNSANYQGGGMHNYFCNPTVTNCTFIGNVANRGGGGGVYNFYSSPTLTGCSFIANVTDDDGGGMHSFYSSNPTLTECSFSRNVADHGGGMYNYYSSPTLTNCAFNNNSATCAAGMFNSHASDSTLTNCAFNNNSATYAAGMCNFNGSNPTLINCMFSGNSADSWGGGMRNSYSSPTLTGCSFIANVTDHDGGGMYNYHYSSPTVTSCTFSGNSASGYGGGIFVDEKCCPTLSNCTFAANSAISGRALGCDSDQQQYPSHVSMTNCILWDGGDEVWNDDGSIITITHSAVEGGWPGEGNIDDDPLFLDPDGPDGVSGTEDDDLRLRAGSPCIDAGSNGAVPYDIADLDDDGDTSERTPLDLAGNSRFVDDPNTDDTGVPDLPDYPYIVDMGAFEYPAAGAQLAASAPANEVSLCRTANNFIRLTFDADITTPADGELLIEVMNSNGAFGTSYTIATDTSADFAVEVVNDGNGDPRILEIWENGSVLTHTDWIAVYNAGGWTDVAEFYLHYPVMKGDVNGDGDVLPTDFGPMFPKIPTFGSDPDERADVDGDRDVLPTDFGPMFPQISTFGADYPKPTGH